MPSRDHFRFRPRAGLAVTSAAVVAAAVATPWMARQDPVAVVAAAAVADASPALTVAAAARAVSGTGRHLGFDTHTYPGERAMAAWKASDANYEWVGYYLPAPCHRDASWAGKRTTLAKQGWGIAVIYVGQQTWSEGPFLTKAQTAAAKRRGASCLPDYGTGERGRTEAQDAIARTDAEGFPAGTVIYLDVERSEVLPPRYRDYYREWVSAVLEDGRYVPGVYVHTHNAEVVHRDFAGVYAAHGVDATPPVWVAGGRGFHRERAPHEVGHTFASMWQGVLDIVETRNGVRLPIDVNVAAVPSPSGPLAMIGADAPLPMAGD